MAEIRSRPDRHNTASGHPDAQILFEYGGMDWPKIKLSDDAPFASRHGVMRGRSLGYDTRRNSTKAFVTLLAVVEMREHLAALSREDVEVLDSEVFDL